jgi:hypothetical protein
VKEDAIEENSYGSSLHGCFAVVEGKRNQVEGLSVVPRGEVMLCVAEVLSCSWPVVFLPATWLAVGGWRIN